MINTLSEITQLWDKSLVQIKSKLGDDRIFESFFQDSYIHEISGDTITVVVNSALAVQLLSNNYYDYVTSTVSDLTESNFIIKFVEKNDVANISRNSQQIKKTSYFLDSKINQDLTFDNFVVGNFNREASQASLLVAKNPGKMFKVLFLHSHSGLGKTHLLHAIGNYITKEGNPNTKILYISANDFVEEYVKFARGEHESESLKDYVCSFDVLLFDDVQFLSDKIKTQDMFFAIYEKMVNNNKQIVVTSDRNPNEIKDLQDRLVTRFNQGLVISIKEPDQNSCVHILERKIESNGLDLSKFDESVLYFFADKFSKNVRELEGALSKLILYTIQYPNTDMITMDVAAQAVEGLVGGKSIATELNEQKIINIVADYYKLTSSQLTGKLRTAEVAMARHIAMYLIRQNLDVSLEKIGDVFGGKDHSTVSSALEHVEKELKTNTQLKQAINDLQKQIKK